MSENPSPLVTSTRKQVSSQNQGILMGWEIQWEPSWWKQGENHGGHSNSAALPGLIRGTQWGHSGSRHFQSQTRIFKHLVLLSNVPMKKVHETSILPFYFVCWCVLGILRPGLALIYVVPMAWNTLCSLRWSEKCVNHPAFVYQVLRLEVWATANQLIPFLYIRTP